MDETEGEPTMGVTTNDRWLQVELDTLKAADAVAARVVIARALIEQ